MTAPCPPWDGVKLKPWEENPFKNVRGHPSHTHPDAPDGPDWWRKKGGWDKFAARLFEQTRELGKMISLLENTVGFREKNFVKNAQRVVQKIKKNHARYKEIKALVAKQERRHAELLAAIQPVEDAMKRGALALNPEVWENYKRNERVRLAQPPRRPIKAKVFKGAHSPPQKDWESE